MNIEDKINSLNPMQKIAVKTTEGPLLLLAGAGSGKTRVLTHRIAYLIEQGVRPFNILAITFTNKAAREMKERVCAITPRGNEVWVSTFHSTCVRILRREIDKLGYSNNFTIYDADDSERLIKNILKDWNIDSKRFSPKFISGVIDTQKNNLVTSEDYLNIPNNDFVLKRVAEIYSEYEKRLREYNALDFNDLIMKTVQLFRTKPEILEKYQERFKYIMVDEYQDTNSAQYQLVKLLASKYENLCVVGDDDQSIYGWRGADIQNILGFEQDFKNTGVIKLEQNYRSTDVILNAANSVIGNNIQRKSKSLWTEYTGGDKITMYQAESDLSEARYICSVINDGIFKGKEYKNFAILYRNNSLSRVIEEALVREGIPYRLFGGTRFYDRKEIRDVMSYLKILYNPDDDISLRRILNVPKRGIGDTTVAKIAEYALLKGMSFYMAMCGCENIPTISSATAKKISAFASVVNDLRASANEISVSELIEEIIDVTGYKEMLEAENTEEANGRLENIGELIGKAVEFEENNPEGDSLSAFLEDVALVADIDGFTEGDDTIVLMTLHSSKGLEFDTVFIAGFEEGIFPSYLSLQDNTGKGLEEERRLCYVGITRAKRHLYFTCARTRMQFGHSVYNLPSKFIKEIPEEYFVNEKQRSNISKPVQQNDTNTFKQRVPFKMPSPKTSAELNVGDKVRHLKYGIGVITDMQGAGADYEYTIDFEMVGTKKLLSHFARLKKI